MSDRPEADAMPRVAASRHELAAGVFVLAAVAGALYLAYRAAPWARSEDVRLHATLARSYGLRDGSPVRMAGVVVGRVTSAKLLASGDAAGKVRVDFFVRGRLDGERLADLFPATGAPDAKVVPEGSLVPGGQCALTIEPGRVGPEDDAGARPVTAADEPVDLPTLCKDALVEIRRAAVSVSELAESFRRPDADGRTPAERVSSLAAGAEDLIGRPAHDGVPPRAGSLAATVASLDDLVAALKDPRRGTIGRLVSSTELHETLAARLDRADEVLAETRRAVDLLVADARRLLDATTKLAERADRVGAASVVTGDEASGARIASMLESAQRTLAHIEAASAKLPAAAEDAAGALHRGKRIVRDTEDAVGARRHWLLSGLFSEQADPWLRVYDFPDDARGVK